MKERVLAILGAIALVAVAFVVRSVVTDDDQQTGGGGGKGQRPVVACTPDLMAICQALADDGKIASDPPALDLGDDAMADDTIDGWITWDPAPGIANIDAPGTWGPSRALGSSPLGVATRSGATPNLPAGCEFASLDWSCIPSAAEQGLAVGVGTGTTSESLARLYPVAAALVPDGGDFTEVREAELATVLTSPASRQQAFPDQFRTLQTAPGALGLLVGPLVALGSENAIVVAQPDPSADLVAVLAPRDGGADLLSDAFESDRVADTLRDAGVTPGAGKLAPEDRAGDLFAVRQKVA